MITVSDVWKAAHEQMLLPEMFVEITMDIPEENTSLVFDKNQIISYTHEQSGDPISRELSMSKIEFSLDNSDGRWNLQNPDGLTVYLCEQRKLTVRYGLQLDSGIEWIQAGVFYLSEWKVPNNGLEAKFIAVDAFGVLRNIEFTRYPTVTPRTTSLVKNYYPTKEDCLNRTNPGEEIVPDTQVTLYECSCEPGNLLSGWRYEGTASPAYKTDRGWIRLTTPTTPGKTDITETIGEALNLLPFSWDSYTDPVISTDKVGPSIIENVSGAEFIQSTCNTILFSHWQDANGLLHFEIPSKIITDYIITRNKSYSFPEIELPTPVGKIFVVGKRDFNYDYTVTGTLLAGEGEDITVDNLYMLTETERSLDIGSTVTGNWIAAYTPRPTLSGEFRVDPRLELFDVVQVEDKFGNLHNTMLTHIKYTYTGSFRGTYEGEII